MKKLLYSILALVAATAYAQQFLPAHKLQYAEQAIAKLYVDSVDQDKLVEDAIEGMLKNLYPHSSYTNAKETKEMNGQIEGSLRGNGITINI